MGLVRWETTLSTQVVDTREQVARQLDAIEAEIRRRQTFSDVASGVFEPLRRPSRYKGLYGGRGGAKSWTFADLLLKRCVDRPGTRAVCVREIQKSLKQSCKRLLEDRIAHFGLGSKFRILSSQIDTPGGGLILFQGMQDHTAESIKSLEGFDVAWAEEAQAISTRSLTLLRPTIRKDDSELWFSWNPRYEDDPVDVLLRVERPPSAIVIKTSYEDNPNFPKVLRDEMEWDRKRDLDKFLHVWGGEYEKKSLARVFDNWKIEEFDTPTNVALMYGGDWGFSVDPSVLVRCWERDEHTLMIDFEAYRVKCEIDDTPALFDMVGCDDCQSERPCDGKGRGHGSARKATIIADSARPETISYLRRHGYPNIRAAKKGANSVDEGIIFLKKYDIVVHPRCKHVIYELTHYSYKVDQRTGLVLAELEDKKNHTIDSLRYAAELVRRRLPVRESSSIPETKKESEWAPDGYGASRGTPRGY